MCNDCNGLTIPIGPQGPQGIQGLPGTNGINGINGINGTNGTNGSNAFKFVKEFTGEDIEQTIVISYAEWSTCGVSPSGCLADGTTTNPFVDVHIQLWLFVAVEFPYWQLLVNGPPATDFSYTTRIDNASGDITIITDGNLGIYRLVILA